MYCMKLFVSHLLWNVCEGVSSHPNVSFQLFFIVMCRVIISHFHHRSQLFSAKTSTWDKFQTGTAFEWFPIEYSKSDLLFTFVLEEKLIKCFCLKFRFVEPPVLDMAAVVEDSSTRTPLIFVLSPGVVSLFVKVKTFFHGFLVTCSHCCSKRW